MQTAKTADERLAEIGAAYERIDLFLNRPTTNTPKEIFENMNVLWHALLDAYKPTPTFFQGRDYCEVRRDKHFFTLIPDTDSYVCACGLEYTEGY